MDHIAFFFIVGLGCALIGWAMVVLTSRLERLRQERHAERYREDRGTPELPRWAQIVRSWFVP